MTNNFGPESRKHGCPLPIFGILQYVGRPVQGAHDHDLKQFQGADKTYMDLLSFKLHSCFN